LNVGEPVRRLYVLAAGKLPDQTSYGVVWSDWPARSPSWPAVQVNSSRARVWLSPDEQHHTLTWDAPGGRALIWAGDAPRLALKAGVRARSGA
jgi:hypothetical protein